MRLIKTITADLAFGRGVDMDIIVDYNPHTREVDELYSIECMSYKNSNGGRSFSGNVVDITELLDQLNVSDQIIDSVDWHEVYADTMQEIKEGVHDQE